MQLSVQVISDVICPWCYIGKRRLEKALSEISALPLSSATLATFDGVTVRWLPYQLNPSMPAEGIRRHEYRIKKFGSLERSQQLDANVKANGMAEGIDFAFERIERTPNTLNAHKLIALAEKVGCQDAVVEALFRAYFTDGIDISQTQTLVNVVASAGLDHQAAFQTLSGDEGLEAFTDAAKLSSKYPIDGVPFFLINQQIALSGAQPSAIFMEAFHRVLTGRT